MKGFYWGTSSVHCSFCGGSGHNITTCKVVDKYANLALDKIEKIPNYICTHHEHRALLEIKKREERKTKLKKPKKPPRCSYCGSLSHKRPKCSLLKQFRLNVYKANKNWKRLLTKRINEVGIGIGSLVRFDSKTADSLAFNINRNYIAMITNYHLPNLNVFCALSEHNRKYQSNTMFEYSSGDKTDSISIKYLGHLLGHGLFSTGWWHQGKDPEVLGKMPWEPDQEWLDSEWDEVLNWFFNDITINSVIEDGMYDFIEHWAEKK